MKKHEPVTKFGELIKSVTEDQFMWKEGKPKPIFDSKLVTCGDDRFRVYLMVSFGSGEHGCIVHEHEFRSNGLTKPDDQAREATAVAEEHLALRLISLAIINL